VNNSECFLVFIFTFILKSFVFVYVEPTVLFDLDDHKKEEGIIDALQTIRGHGAVTLTAPALRKAADVIYMV
jgi:hypothetical protein